MSHGIILVSFLCACFYAQIHVVISCVIYEHSHTHQYKFPTILLSLNSKNHHKNWTLKPFTFSCNLYNSLTQFLFLHGCQFSYCSSVHFFTPPFHHHFLFPCVPFYYTLCTTCTTVRFFHKIRHHHSSDFVQATIYTSLTSQ